MCANLTSEILMRLFESQEVRKKNKKNDCYTLLTLTLQGDKAGLNLFKSSKELPAF